MEKKGFALVEVLIAVTILSIVLLSVFSGVSTTIYAMSGQKSYSRAMIVAKNKMNDFILENMRGLDLAHEQVEGYDGYSFSRETARFEHPLLGPLPAKKTVITVYWKDGEKEKEYSISFIYPEK